MISPTSVVPYWWNNFDRCMACLHGNVTPYDIPSERLNECWGWTKSEPVRIPLGLSLEPAKIARFFREGYEWVKVPEEVPLGGNFIGYFAKLHAYDDVRFAHLDPLLVTATAARRNVDRVKRMMHSTLDVGSSGNSLTPDPTIAAVSQIFSVVKELSNGAELVPFEDLVRLHLEYWGNSRLRAAFVNARVPSYPAAKMDVFRTIPFTFMPGQFLAKTAFGVTDLLPEALMATTEQGDAKLEWVLARKTVSGVPVRTLGTPSTVSGPRIRVMSIPPPRIELDGFAVQELLPFHLKEWKTGETKLTFRVTIPAPVAKTTIEILEHRKVIYTETKEGGEWIVPGVHLWKWDGYDSDGVFDTILLKSNQLEARVTTTDMYGRVAVGRTKMGTGPGNIRWVDARLDRKKKVAEVTAYVHFRNPSEVELTGFKVGVPEALGNFLDGAMKGLSGMESNLAPLLPFADEIPDAASLDSLLDDVPLLDMIRPPSMAEMLNKRTATISLHLPDVFDLSREDFDTYKNDIVYGIGYHWSRDITVDGEKWELAVSCRERPVDNVPIFLMKGISDVAKGFGWTQMDPDVGFLGSQNTLDRSVNLACFGEGLPILDIWEGDSDPVRRRQIGAHELGHSVLREAYDPFTSATHKGTTSVFGAGGQRSNNTDPEIDLMYYPDRLASETQHHIAVEDDARALVWLARVTIG